MERNFHVFYYLFADEEERQRLKLTVAAPPSIRPGVLARLPAPHAAGVWAGKQTPQDFSCLGGQLWDDNTDMFEELSDALEVVGFTTEERQDLKSILAAIMHLLNVNFTEEGEHADVKNRDPLQHAAELLQVLSPPPQPSPLSLVFVAHNTLVVLACGRRWSPARCRKFCSA